MRLIAVRHAETDWNRIGREMGQLDSPLTSQGRAQAAALADRLAAVGFDELYTSDLGRAVATADYIARRCGRLAHRDPDLRERHMGVLQGLTSQEIDDRYPAIRDEYKRLGFYDEIAGGESAAARRDRSIRAFDRLAERHASARVVVVTHGGLLTGFLEVVLDLPFGDLAPCRRRTQV